MENTSFWSKNKYKILSIGVFLIATFIDWLRYDDNNDCNNSICNAIVEKPEKLFHGVPVKKLDEIAKSCYHGVGVYISHDGYLYYRFKSNRGHQTFESQMSVGNGKIAPLFGSNYRSIDEFLEKVRNSVVFID